MLFRSEEPGGLQSLGSQRVGHDSEHTYTGTLSSGRPRAPWSEPLVSAFIPALLNNQVPPSPIQIEEKPLSPPVMQHAMEAEKQLIREVRRGAGRWASQEVGLQD